MEARVEARFIAGAGIDGDRYTTGLGTYSIRPHVDRQVTLIEVETLEALARDRRIVLDAREHRHNLTTRGVPLGHLVGHFFHVGGVVRVGDAITWCDPGALDAAVRQANERIPIEPAPEV
jgi:MOSC domain-containing protein YiiM